MNRLKILLPAIILLFFRGHTLAQAAAKKEAAKKSTTSEMVNEFIKNFSSLDKAKEYFGQVIEKTMMIVKNPTQFRNEIILIVGILVALLLVFVTMVIMISSMRQRAETKRLVADIKVKQKQGIAVQKISIGVTTTIILLLAFYFWTSSPTFCANCHQVENSYKTWMTAEHKTVACLGCHAEPGASGYLRSQLDGFDNLVRFKFSGNIELKTRVKNEACLKCHGKIYDRIRPSDIVMRHKDVIDAGISCTDCHPATSHGKTQKKFFVMDKCVVCHDGTQAKADCKGCHKDDIASRKNLKIEDFPKVRDAGIRCYTACHDQTLIKLCTDCHGLVMPHPPYFKSIHAAVATKRPVLCNRCHRKANSPEETCGCHPTSEVHGDYMEWFKLHSGDGYRMMGGSCTCHKPGFCTGCHDYNDLREQY